VQGFAAARSLTAAAVSPFQRSAPAELALGTLVGLDHPHKV